jgi:hypothetical protein
MVGARLIARMRRRGPVTPQILSESLEQVLHHAGFRPLAKPPMTSLIGRVAGRQAGPGDLVSKDVKDAVQNVAALLPRAAATILAMSWRRDEGLYQLPFKVGQIVMSWHVTYRA